MPHPELVLFFFLIALIYASVGFGGGSSYLALLAIYNLPFPEMRLTALICNIIVVSGGCIIFLRSGQIDSKKILPLVLVSVPMAFFGASLKISQQVFFIVLGSALIIAAVLLWVRIRIRGEGLAIQTVSPAAMRNILPGASIGFLSGLVGIGGGIFLSPLLNLMNWDTPKKIAATASVFILLNSLAGIAGQIDQTPIDINYRQLFFLALAVFVGGQIGSRLAADWFKQIWVRRITALLVFAAGIEVLHKHL